MVQFKRNVYLVLEVVYLMPVRQSELRISAWHIFLFPKNIEDEIWNLLSPLSNGQRGLRPRK